MIPGNGTSPFSVAQRIFQPATRGNLRGQNYRDRFVLGVLCLLTEMALPVPLFTELLPGKGTRPGSGLCIKGLDVSKLITS